MDPFNTCKDIFHWKCGTKMQTKNANDLGLYDRLDIPCCACLKPLSINYYECSTCYIPKHPHSRSQTNYHYRYCSSCATCANYLLSSMQQASCRIYHQYNECGCGGTLTLKLHDALQDIGQWSYMRDDIHAPYRFIKLLCNGCKEEIDTFSIYLSCSNNDICMMEHTQGFRYCLYCVEFGAHLPVLHMYKSIHEDSDESDDENDEEEDDDEDDNETAEEDTNDDDDDNDSNALHLPTSATDCLFELLDVHVSHLVKSNEEWMEEKLFCEQLQQQMHQITIERENELNEVKESGYLSERITRNCSTAQIWDGTIEMFNDERFAVPLIYHVFAYCINHYMMLVRLCRVNKLFHAMLTFKGKQKEDMEVYYLSDIWKRICFVQWPALDDVANYETEQNIKDLKVSQRFKRRWDIYFRIRFDKLRQTHVEKETKKTRWMKDIEDIKPFHYKKQKMDARIENCEIEKALEVEIEDEIWEKVLPDGYEWKVKCPLFMNQLQWKSENNAYFCSVCDKNVYHLDTRNRSYAFKERLKMYLDEKKCVAITFHDRDFDDNKTVMKWKYYLVKGEAAPFRMDYSSETSSMQ